VIRESEEEMKKGKSSRGKRFSANKKMEAVLRLLKGEPLDEVARSVGRPAHELESWRREFIEAGMAALKSRKDDVSEKRLKSAQAKIGDLAMRLELAEMLLEKKGYMEDAKKLRRPLT
jgi:hypothetical protein